MAGDALDLVQRQHHVRRGAGRLEDEDVAGNAPALGDLRGAGDVVGGEHGARLDALHFEEFGGHVEVHHVAGIVAVHEEHAGATAGGHGRIDGRLGRRRGKDVADGRGIRQALPDEAEEGRLVARPAADDQRHLARARPFSRNDGSRRTFRSPQVLAMGGDDAGQHLVHDGIAVIDQFLRLAHRSSSRKHE